MAFDAAMDRTMAYPRHRKAKEPDPYPITKAPPPRDGAPAGSLVEKRTKARDVIAKRRVELKF